MPKLKTKSGAKKRFKVTATGKVNGRPARQAPRHDQADEEADSSAPRHARAVQDRWRQHQEILPAERLIVLAIPLSRAAFARRSVTTFLIKDSRHVSRQTRL